MYKIQDIETRINKKQLISATLVVASTQKARTQLMSESVSTTKKAESTSKKVI